MAMNMPTFVPSPGGVVRPTDLWLRAPAAASAALPAPTLLADDAEAAYGDSRRWSAALVPFTGLVVPAVAALGRAATRRVPRSATKSAPPAFNPAAQLGAMNPLGYFDPIGFCKVGDEAGFRKFRAAELKHGRVAMMASIGAVGQPFLKFSAFDGVKGTFGAMSSQDAVIGFGGIFLACGILELFAWTESDDKEPGNFGDPLKLNMYNEDMRLKEINNGRMAMFAVLGIFGAEITTGKDALEQLGM